eukprot:4732132-Prymnesium_polylepis.1
MYCNTRMYKRGFKRSLRRARLLMVVTSQWSSTHGRLLNLNDILRKVLPIVQVVSVPAWPQAACSAPPDAGPVACISLVPRYLNRFSDLQDQLRTSKLNSSWKAAMKQESTTYPSKPPRTHRNRKRWFVTGATLSSRGTSRGASRGASRGGSHPGSRPGSAASTVDWGVCGRA